MQTKYDKFEQLCDEKLKELTASKENWLGFLDTSSRMYKYNFEDQILIHAQRPDSKAVAPFEFWTAGNRMNRHIKKGTNSISLIDRETKRLHYVYAMEDTEDRVNGKSKNPENYIWKIPDSLVENINSSLCTKGKIQSNSLEQTIVQMAESASRAELKNYDDEFEALYLESGTELTREELTDSFSKMLSASATIMAMKRCGMDTSNFEEQQDFTLLDKIPPAFTKLLGEMTGISAKTVLRFTELTVHEEIEKERKRNEIIQRGNITENQSRERDSVRSGRNNNDLSSRLGDEGRIPHQEVGQSERTVSDGTSQSDIQRTSDAESAERASAQRGLTGTGDNRADNEIHGESGRTDGGNEGYGYAEVGRTDGELPQHSGGDNQTRADREINTDSTAEVENTASAVSYADKIHEAFTEVNMQFNFQPGRQKYFMKKYEEHLIGNHPADPMDVERAFDLDDSFSVIFGNVSNLKRCFHKQLPSVLVALQTAMHKAFNTTPKFTKEEQLFLEANLEPAMAKSILAWDEIEGLGYIFFEEGYIDRFSPSDRAIYGNGVYEKDAYALSEKMRNGEDIRVDLTKALFGNQKMFRSKNDRMFTIAYNKDNITASFGNVERSLSYEAIGDAFLSLFQGEYNEILKARQEEEAREQAEKSDSIIPEVKENSIKFSWGAEPDDDWFTESNTLFEIVEENPNMSYALANAVMEYLDEKQHIERGIPELNAGWYDKTSFRIEYTIDGDTATYDGRYDIGDGKGTGGGTLTEHIQQYLDYVAEKNPYHYSDCWPSEIAVS